MSYAGFYAALIYVFTCAMFLCLVYCYLSQRCLKERTTYDQSCVIHKSINQVSGRVPHDPADGNSGDTLTLVEYTDRWISEDVQYTGTAILSSTVLGRRRHTSKARTQPRGVSLAAVRSS
jgi:hypothetical protein